MKALWIWLNVIGALIRREALTRFGKLRFGYIFAFIEPAIYILGFSLIRSYVSGHPIFGTNALLFLVTGLLTVRTILITAGRTMGAISSNLTLLTFPQVKTFDTIFGRAALEVITMASVAIAFVFGMYVFADIWLPADVEVTVTAYAATLFFAVSFGAFNAVVSRLFPFYERLWGIFSLAALISSGAFFLPASLPPQAMQILQYNPMLHLVEWVRSGVYIGYTPFLDTHYVLTVAVVMLFIALFINQFFQRVIVSN